MKTHELFVLPRAIYIYLWRGDSDEKEMEASIGKWLNLVQSCVPDVNVLPVCTHIDCASPAEVKRKCEFVKKALKSWEEKQKCLPNSSGTQIVHILNDCESFCVNCLTGEVIVELRSAVKDTSRNHKRISRAPSKIVGRSSVKSMPASEDQEIHSLG
jgi:hypothetical protein